jgi:hypothetical protein
MVDMVTYGELHPDNDPLEEREYLDDDAMEAEEPPNANFVSLLPSTVHGFGFQDKKWRGCLD